MIQSMKPVGKSASFRQSIIRRFAIVAALSLMYLMPVAALAADEEVSPVDARLENYPAKVALEPGGTAFSWVIFLVLAALCVGVMLKSANRSHLD
jgi:hypothetical protein